MSDPNNDINPLPGDLDALFADLDEDTPTTSIEHEASPGEAIPAASPEPAAQAPDETMSLREMIKSLEGQMQALTTGVVNMNSRIEQVEEQNKLLLALPSAPSAEEPAPTPPGDIARTPDAPQPQEAPVEPAHIDPLAEARANMHVDGLPPAQEHSAPAMVAPEPILDTLASVPDPLAAAPMADPLAAARADIFADAPMADPLAAAPMADPLAAAPMADPLAQAPMADPLAQAPMADPLAQAPMADPLAQAPMADPLAAAPMADPLAQAPLADPLAAAPMADPLAQAPMADPLAAARADIFADAPMADPLAQAPIADPLAQAPMADPLAAAPIADPLAQAPMAAQDFAHLMPEQARAHAAADVPPAARQALDVMWAAASPQESSVNQQQQQQAAAELAKIAERREGKRRKPQKLKMERLPFRQIPEGHPLIIAVTSPKGGVGKSTTAVSMAAYIAEVGRVMSDRGAGEGLTRTPRVCVLDGDISNGNLAIRVAKRMEPNLLDLMYALDKGDFPRVYDDELGAGQHSIKEHMIWHEDLPNLNLLAAPEDAEVFLELQVADYERVLDILRQFFDVIVIDVGTEIVLPSNQTWLRHAHQVFLLTVPEVATLWSSAQYASLITNRPMGENKMPLVDLDRLNIVIMRSDAEFVDETAVDPVKRFFNWADSSRVFRFHDFDRETTLANNRHAFLVLENADYNADIGQLVNAAFANYVASGQAQRGGF